MRAAVLFATAAVPLQGCGESPTGSLWGKPSNMQFSFNRTLKLRKKVQSLAFSPSSWLATGSDDQTVRIFCVDEVDNTTTGQPVEEITPHDTDSQGWIRSVAYSADNKWLASGSTDQTVRLYRLSEQGLPDAEENYTLWDTTFWIQSVAFSPDSRWLASGSDDGEVRLYALQDHKPRLLHTIGIDMYFVTSVAFSADSKLLASGSDDSKVRIYEIGQGLDPQMVHTLTEATEFVESVAFSSDAKWFASASDDGLVRLYRLRGQRSPHLEHILGRGREVFGQSGKWIKSVAFSADAHWLASGADNGKVRVYHLEAKTGPSLMREICESDSVIRSVAFSLDSRWFATGSEDHKVRLYSIISQRTPAPADMQIVGTWVFLALVFVLVLVYTVRSCGGPEEDAFLPGAGDSSKGSSNASNASNEGSPSFPAATAAHALWTTHPHFNGRGGSLGGGRSSSRHGSAKASSVARSR